MRRPDAIAHLNQAIVAGDDVNEHSGDGCTAFHGSVENGGVEKVKPLLACGEVVKISQLWLIPGKPPLILLGNKDTTS